jgi:hypothetical protein
MDDTPAHLLTGVKLDADYYRAREEEVRERAASTKSIAVRSKLLQIADRYGGLALAQEMANKRHGGALDDLTGSVESQQREENAPTSIVDCCSSVGRR